MIKLKNNHSGFTLLEVLLATVLLGISLMGLVKSVRNSFRSTRLSADISKATALAQMTMTEMELKFQKAIDKESIKSAIGKEAGKYEAPFEAYTWKAEFKENPFVFSKEIILDMFKNFGIENAVAEQQFDQQKLIIANLNKTFRENLGELIVVVDWDFLGKKKTLQLVQHLIPRNPKVQFSQSENVDNSLDKRTDETSE